MPSIYHSLHFLHSPGSFSSFEVCEELRITKILAILFVIYGSQQWGLDPERAPNRVCYICTYLPGDFFRYHDDEYFQHTDTDKFCFQPRNLSPALEILIYSCLKTSQN